MRRSRGSAFTSPVIVGAVTVLIVLVAVFLAYNANEGLPFVPTQELKVDIADGSDIVIGNDVREGGFRVGLVSDAKPVQLPSGQVGAQLTLQIDEAHAKIPRDSFASIRPVSVLGTKYVNLQPGTSKQLISNGGVLPVSRTRVPVQFDDVFKTFNTKTRTAIQNNLQGYGNTLAARGSSLNDTIAALPRLLGHLEPVARSLSAPSTELTRFIGSLNQFMSAVAPEAQINVQLFRHMATTFGALAKSPSDLENTIKETPPTLSVGTDSLAAQRPFLSDFTTLGGFLAPATASLRQALPTINPAIEQGTRVLGRTPPLDKELQQVMNALKNLATAPGTNLAVNALTGTVTTLNPVIRYLGPFQTVCDDWNYWWTYLSEHLSAQTSYGYAQRALINFGSISGNGVGQQGANAPANGVSGAATAPLFGGTEYLHAQPYGAAIDNQGNADCETGQRGYPLKLNHLDPQGRNLATDPHTPGSQGATFAGRTHVPAGETFTRAPQTGPQLANIPQNP
jgi:virulence factor Mce-like protein